MERSLCSVTTITGASRRRPPMTRYLDEYDVFVRDERGCADPREGAQG